MNKHIEKAKEAIREFAKQSIENNGGNISVPGGVSLETKKNEGETGGWNISIQQNKNFISQHVPGETEDDVYDGLVEVLGSFLEMNGIK